MKRGIFYVSRSVLIVSLLGAIACGDDAHHDAEENPAEESDGGEVRYSEDGSVIVSGDGRLDGGADDPYTPPSHSGDAGDEGESADGGRGGRGNGGGGRPTFDAGARGPFERDGGLHLGPGPVVRRDAGVREPVTPIERDAGGRAPVERDAGRRPR